MSRLSSTYDDSLLENVYMEEETSEIKGNEESDCGGVSEDLLELGEYGTTFSSQSSRFWNRLVNSELKAKYIRDRI